MLKQEIMAQKRNNKQETKETKEMFPYRLFYRIRGGMAIRMDDRVEATNSAQALEKFRNMYSKVRDYEAIGEVWVELDSEEYKRRKDTEKSRAEDRQNTIDNAWWNQ